MSTPFTRAIVAAALVLSTAGCSREESSTAENKGGNPSVTLPLTDAVTPDAAPEAVQEAQADFPPATELQIDKIQTVMVRRAIDMPTDIVIRASGSVVSPGWTAGRLTPMEDPAANDRVRVYAFVAMSPEVPGEDRKPQSIQTELRVNNVPAGVRTVRIVSATNAISAPIAQ